MPIIDGKVRRAVFTSLKLNELSGVDRPAQPGAIMAILKRADDAAATITDPVAKKETDMAKTVEELQAEVDKLNGQVTTLTSERDAATKRADDAEKGKGDAEAAQKAAETAKAEAEKKLADATDEVVKVDDSTEVRKSEVGEAAFKALRATANQRDSAIIEKRVGEEFPNVVGSTAEKALVLKAVASLPEDARKAFEAIMTSAQKMAAAGFERFGRTDEEIATAQKATGDWKAVVAEIEKRDNIPTHEAMTKARNERPDLFVKHQEALEQAA